MDVPTRQAYVVAVVHPSERTAAAAYTNTARYLTRPIAPLAAGPLLQFALGAPFLIAGALKAAYDVGLYALFRRVEIPHQTKSSPTLPSRERNASGLSTAVSVGKAHDKDGAFMEPRGGNRAQSTANRAAAETAKISQIRCRGLPPVAASVKW